MRTYVSLFAGIGGLDLAAEALGFKCSGQVEWDAACTRVLKRWWPTVPRWGDVHGFTAASYAERQRCRESCEPHGEQTQRRIGTPRWRDPNGLAPALIVGGFPCQPVSTAGKRKGQQDDRWLWPEFARVIGELRPRLALVENVPGLLTVNGGRAFSEILGDLAALGYDATWTSVRASDVGACHRRERIFLLAERADSDGDGSGTAPDSAGGRRRAQGSGLRSPAAPGIRGGRPDDGDPGAFPWGPYEAAIRRHERLFGRAAPEPVDGRGRLSPVFVEWMMGFPEGWTEDMSRTQALKALGNAVVPQQAVAAFMLLDRLAQEA